MSRTLSGIHGVPFRKIVSREFRSDWIVETLSCGHKNSVGMEKYSRATKRRCYHPACKIPVIPHESPQVVPQDVDSKG